MAQRPKPIKITDHDLIANSYGDLMLVIPAQRGEPHPKAKVAVRADRAEALLMRTGSQRCHLPGMHATAAKRLALATSVLVTELDPISQEPRHAYRVPVQAA